jgi:hypothetical protein
MNSVGSDFELLQESDAVKINGKDVSVADLVSAYKTKSNEFPPKEKDKEEEEKENGNDVEEAREECAQNLFHKSWGNLSSAERDKVCDKLYEGKTSSKKEDCTPKKGAKVCDKCGAKLNEFPPKDKEEEEVKKDAKEEEEEEVKKDAKPPINPQTDEGDTAVTKNSKSNGKEFFMELENAKLNAQPNLNDFGSTTATTREDRAANGKKFFGSRKR